MPRSLPTLGIVLSFLLFEAAVQAEAADKSIRRLDGSSSLADDPRYQKITARMSLAHTSGLPNWRWFEEDRKLHIHFEPGTRYSYSGEGLTFLQVVLERKTQKTLEELTREKVFVPHGMTASSYAWQPRFEQNFCHGHDEAGKVLEKDKDNAPRSASTLETTPEDYTRFLRAVLNARASARSRGRSCSDRRSASGRSASSARSRRRRPPPTTASS